MRIKSLIGFTCLIVSLNGAVPLPRSSGHVILQPFRVSGVYTSRLLSSPIMQISGIMRK